MRHGLARESLLLHGIETAMEITSIGDLPGRAGIGSSGSYLVAMLSASMPTAAMPVSQFEIAEEACDIEINRLREPVGKQEKDQYMAALGGLRCLDIVRNGEVKTHDGIAFAIGSLHRVPGQHPPLLHGCAKEMLRAFCACRMTRRSTRREQITSRSSIA